MKTRLFTVSTKRQQRAIRPETDTTLHPGCLLDVLQPAASPLEPFAHQGGGSPSGEMGQVHQPEAMNIALHSRSPVVMAMPIARKVLRFSTVTPIL